VRASCHRQHGLCGSAQQSPITTVVRWRVRHSVSIPARDGGRRAEAACVVLPVVLPQDDVVELRHQLRDNPGATISVDLAQQTVTGPDSRLYRFDIHPVRKKCLLEGLDDIARTAQYDDATARFEAAYKAERPWLYQAPRAS
jgi:3-isopropylmalate/(R)-2-methylmalate dehydratase small subunit